MLSSFEKITTIYKNLVGADFTNGFYTTLMQKGYLEIVNRKLAEIHSVEEIGEDHQTLVYSICHNVIKTMEYILALNVGCEYSEFAYFEFFLQLINTRSNLTLNFKLDNLTELMCTMVSRVSKHVLEQELLKPDSLFYSRLHELIDDF